jgi:hypothetical protein
MSGSSVGYRRKKGFVEENEALSQKNLIQNKHNTFEKQANDT